MDMGDLCVRVPTRVQLLHLKGLPQSYRHHWGAYRSEGFMRARGLPGKRAYNKELQYLRLGTSKTAR